MIDSLRFEIVAMTVMVISFLFFLIMNLRITALKTTKNQVFGLFLQHWSVARTITEEEEENLDNEDNFDSLKTKASK